MPQVPIMPNGFKEEGNDGGWAEWELWARNELMLTGSELSGKLLNLQVLFVYPVIRNHLELQFTS